MRRHSEGFPLVLIFCALLLGAVLKSAIEDAIKAWGTKHFASWFGDAMTAEFATRIVEQVPALVLAGGIVWWLFRYIDKQYSTPRLQCAFDGTDAGCVRRDAPVVLNGYPTTADWYRVKVETATTHAATGCHGRLIAIERDGEITMTGEQLKLPFAPGNAPDAMSKTVFPDRREDLDFLAITASDFAFVPPHLQQIRSSSIDWDGLFKQPGSYVIHLVIVSENSASFSINIPFKWTGKKATAQVLDA